MKWGRVRISEKESAGWMVKGQLSRVFEQSIQQGAESVTSLPDVTAIINNSSEKEAYATDPTAKSARKQQETDLNLSRVEGGLENAGRIETALSVSLRNDGSPRKEKDKQKTLDLLIRLEQLRVQLLERIGDLQKQIDRLLEERDRIGRSLEALEQCLDNGRQTGHFEIRDPLVTEAIRQWEQQHGQPWDPEAEDAADRLISMMKKYKGEYDRLSLDIQSRQEEQDYLWNQVEQIDAALEGREFSTEEAETMLAYRQAEQNPEAEASEKNTSSGPSPEHGIIDLTKMPSLN